MCTSKIIFNDIHMLFEIIGWVKKIILFELLIMYLYMTMVIILFMFLVCYADLLTTHLMWTMQ